MSNTDNRQYLTMYL